jgi:hypothetical protein
VTAFSPYQAYPGPAPVLAAPPPVLVAVADRVPQRRVTVAFRLLLAVPHLFVLYWLTLAAGVVAFLGWWGALFTGRLPQFAVNFLSGFLRWTIRVSAYEYLLTDVYPPFTFDDDPTYPVRLAIPEAQRLNRAAVFFRYILLFPANLLAAIVILGAGTLMGFIAWLVTLVTGQMPASFHLAYAAVLRFQARLHGYWWMLTPAYPGGLYGDGPGAVAWADALPAAQAPGFGTPAPGFEAPGSAYGTPGPAYGTPADSAPGGYGAPGYGAPGGYEAPAGYGAPGGYGAPAGYGAPGGYGAPAGYSAPAGSGVPAGYGAPGGYSVRPLFQPATWLLPLTAAAKKLVTTFIVLGSLFLVGYIVLYAVLIGSAVSNSQNAVTAANQLNSSHATLTNSLNAWERATTNCNQNLPCVTKQDSKAASAFSTFSSQLANTSVPASAAADKATLSAVAAAATRDFIQLSKSTSDSQYQSTITSTGLQQTLNSFDEDFTALITNLQSY